MNKYEQALERGHSIEFDAYRFDSPDYDALMVTEENYLEHLRVQAAGLAYYGTLAKQAERDLAELELRYKNRYNEMYSECASVINRTGQKNTVKDIETFVETKYESELSRWRSELSEARKNCDGISSYYDAWKAKGFALSSMTSLITAGLLGPKTVITEEDVGRSRERRMNAREALGIIARNRKEDPPGDHR